MLISRRSFRVFFGLSIATLILSACADMHPASEDQESDSSADLRVTKVSWMKELPQAMSDELCDEGSALLRCYPVSANECQQRVSDLTVSCENDYEAKIPSKLQEWDTVRWGDQIGRCTMTRVVDLLELNYAQGKSEDCAQSVQQM